MTTSVRIVALTRLQDTEQTISLVLALSFSWYDPFLSWDPEQFGGIKSLALDQSKAGLWTPEAYQLHSPSNTGSLKDLPTHWRLNHTGHASFRTTGDLTASCDLDLTYFPFDTQSCVFQIGVLDYTDDELILGKCLHI